MSEFAVEGDELKRMVKLGRKGPIGFAFNPGKSDDEHLLAMHRKKTPAILGKAAKKEGAGNKAAFGTFKVSGKIMSLTCEREVPAMAKKLKKYLKSQKVQLNIQILDADGNLLEEDIEELPDDLEVDGGIDPDEADDDADVSDDAVIAQADDANNDASDDGEDQTAALTERLRALQPRIKTAPPAAVDKLAAAFKAVVGLVKAADLTKAEASIDRLEAVLDKFDAEAATADNADEGTGIPSPPPPPPDPRLAKLRDAAAQIAKRTANLPDGAARESLAEGLRNVAIQLKTGEAEGALTGLKALQEALKAAVAATDSDKAKWEASFTRIEPAVNQAMSQSLAPDVGSLRASWFYAVEQADNGDYAKALARLPRIENMLNGGRGVRSEDQKDDGVAAADPSEVPDPAVPRGVVAFQRSRIMWIGAKKRMVDQIGLLRDTIISQSADDDDAYDIKKACESMIDHVRAFDDRLEDVLEEITVTPEGPARTKLKGQAADVIREYSALLDTSFFQSVDSNPFGIGSVTPSARQSLGAISKALV